MIIIILLIVLVISFSLHVHFGIKFVSTRQKKFLTWYLNTAASNMLSAGFLIYFSLKNPQAIRSIDPKIMFWVLSGIVLAVSLKAKVSILRNIYLRAQDPEHYHLNFFGKKVLNATVVKPTHVLGFFATLPFFLIAGAYFVARLINIIMYGHL